MRWEAAGVELKELPLETALRTDSGRARVEQEEQLGGCGMVQTRHGAWTMEVGRVVIRNGWILNTF